MIKTSYITVFEISTTPTIKDGQVTSGKFRLERLSNSYEEAMESINEFGGRFGGNLLDFYEV